MLVFYKPNKNGTGSLINFNIATGKSDKGKPYQEGAVFVTMMRQTSWNAERHTGSFKGGESIVFKLNLTEVGKILNTLRGGDKFSNFHGSKGRSTTIMFTPWLDKDTQEKKGYGLRVNKEQEGKESAFQIGFQLGEDILLEEFFKVAIQKILMGNYAEDKRRAKEKKVPTLSVETETEDTELVDEVEAMFSGD